jgi:hypothetical protein
LCKKSIKNNKFYVQFGSLGLERERIVT